MRVNELIPQILVDELLRVVKLDKDWVRWEDVAENGFDYRAYVTVPTKIKEFCTSGADYFSMKATSHWLYNGPKIFRPTKEQCAAMEQVDVNLLLEDYSQPYPAIMILLDYQPFHSVLCYREEQILVCVLMSKSNIYDITSCHHSRNQLIESSLSKFDPECKKYGAQANKALRVACNCCLALSHYGHHTDYLYPQEAARDKRLARENTERGAKARKRLPLAVQQVTFSQEVVLHKTESHCSSNGEGTGKEVSCHWRRGHWASQCYGPKNTLRKRILRPPVLVRADLFVGELSDTVTTYRT